MASPIQHSSERINNVRAFTQGVNVNQVRDETTKNLLALEDACREMASTEQERRHNKEGAPRLVAPKMSLAQALAFSSKPTETPSEDVTAKRSAGLSPKSGETSGFNAAASLLGSMAELRHLLHNSTLGELRGRLQLINTESSALREQGEKLLSVLESGLGELQTANDKAASCEQAWQQGKETVQDLTQQKLALETKLSNNKLSPYQDAGLQADITALESQLADAKLNLATLETHYNQALAQATTIAQTADKSRVEINKFIEAAPRTPQVEGERWESALSLLTLLTAQLKKAMNDDSIKNMRQQQEIMETISEASRKDSEKKAKEAEEAQRKADESSKAASCTSKIIGWVMVAVAAVALVVSFGTAGPVAIALAAIGLAMAIADVVLEATGQSSLMGMLAEKISEGVTNMLIIFGVPEDEAKKIGSIVGMVLAAVAFLALSLASMSSFVKNAVTTVTKVVAKVVVKQGAKLAAKMATQVATKVGSKAANLSKPLAKFAGKADDVVKVADTANNVGKVGNAANVTARQAELGLNGTSMALGVTNAAVSGGLNLHASAQIRDMKELMADMLLNNAALQAIDELLKALIKGMSKEYDQINEMFEGMLTALNESGHAKANMMKSSFA
ncbi:type III secretion system translocon subunit SctE [Yersinia mollaretii]|uniref:type III secretion system translocon subunit SctE n=1 Tax=Yersinia mollaretii TaxID=33060 RepID=UPI0005E916EF|nr:type III secretion system translocon subunit SctE [Yersinia mollaretii]PJE86369.1 type III secretion protein [Yersinia mollaretii]CQD37141.1 putative type III secretion system effector protein [Yersinia mollaretii]CQH29486.1 putative type III secretion system effector protein [Yersinia mollaretii]